MENLLSKIENVKTKLEEQYGEFYLFCVVELSDSQGYFDIVVSGRWLLQLSNFEATLILYNSLNDFLSEDELTKISNISILHEDEKFVKEVIFLSIYVSSILRKTTLCGLEINNLHVLSKPPLKTDLSLSSSSYKDLINFIKAEIKTKSESKVDEFNVISNIRSNETKNLESEYSSDIRDNVYYGYFSGKDSRRAG